MNYKKEVLAALIDSYEKSKWFREGISSRKVFLPKKKKEMIEGTIKDYDQKQFYFHALFSLKEAGVIDFQWQKYEEGNLIDSIWLIPEQDAIDTAYQILNRRKKEDVIAEFASMIKETLSKINQDSGIYQYLDQVWQQAKDNLKIPMPFSSEDMKLNQDILKCLVFLSKNQEEVLTRIMSQKLFQNTKYFERELRSKILSILKKISSNDTSSEKDLLLEYGITDYPEIIEFVGNIKIRLDNGAVIDYSKECYGAYINSETIRHILSVSFDQIHRVLFIENKANYVMAVKECTPNTLILFHGGCYSPIKGKFFQKIYEFAKEPEKILWEHWSDIDVGGFRIFTRLQKNIIPYVKPCRMDQKTLLTYKEHAMQIKSKRYLETLQKMRNDPTYEMFHPVIDVMFEEKIRLEQEVECVL